MMRPQIIQFILLSLMSVRGVDCVCRMEDESCEFYLTVEHHLTMMDGSAAVFPHGGNLYRYDVTNTSTATPVDPANVVQADGYEPQRLVTLANGTMPGPAIEVYEGQIITVHVTNLLYNEGTSIHWHGMHQKNTPFMDGVSFITQCPILQEQTFKYRFKAKPKGTFWYHSHTGNQRTMGLFGPLIVREKKPQEMEEFIMSLQDWNHDDATTVHLKMNFGGFENRKELLTTKAFDGSLFSRFFMISGLINGRGRIYDEFGGHNGAPLTVFDVTQGKRYRFRVIAAGHLYPFRVSIDGHELTLVASDGYELQPKIVESFIINPGERIDFVLNASKNIGSYWIRTQTLEVDVNHRSQAILRYSGAPITEPTSTKRVCTPTRPCTVVNCPYTYSPEPNTKCVRFDQLKSLENDPAPSVIPGKFKEHFLNFAFPGLKHYPGQANGHKFKMPAVSGLTQYDEITTTCDKEDCGEDRTCHCTFALDLNYGDTVQMVLVNMGRGRGWNHPMHLHGHSFYVLKMGYAQYNSSNGKIIGDNSDIDCANTTYGFCNYPTWANKSWSGDNIPGLELQNPPRKDTIIVPTRGYVIIRILADNPGLWFMHCHIEMHNADGMAMVINEARDHLPKPPKNFPKCSPFNHIVDDDDNKENKTVTGGNTEGMYRSSVFWAVVGCLIGVCVLQFLVLICMCWRRCEGSGREKDWNQHQQEQSFPSHVNQAFQMNGEQTKH